MIRLSVVGLGKLGLPIACAFASKGVSVIGVDRDERVLESIKNSTPTIEPGVTEEALNKISIVTTGYDIAIPNSEVTLVIVPTPSENMAFSNHFVLEACQQIGTQLAKKKGSHAVVIVSTVMPGSIDGPIRLMLESSSGKLAGEHFSLLYNPQFVALGSVYNDFMQPDMVLIGRSRLSSILDLVALYDRVLQGLPRYVVVDAVNAEVAKLSLNCYVSMKATFANHLARVVECIPGADVDRVTEIIGHDRRIGHDYLRAGIMYGGPCFPRDVMAMATLHGSHLFSLIDLLNDSSIRQLAKDVLATTGDVGILGYPYKAGTLVIEGSPGAHLYRQIAAAKRTVIADISMTPADVVDQSDVVVIVNQDQEYLEIPVEVWGSKPRIVFDVWRTHRNLEAVAGIDYRPIGVGPKK